MVVSLLLLPSCAGGVGFSEHSPQVFEESMKSRDALEQCLLGKLARLGPPNVAEQNDNRVVIKFRISSPPVTVVINDLDHQPYESTRSIEIWKTGPRDNQLGRDARACK
jgi:hypothetical protein